MSLGDATKRRYLKTWFFRITLVSCVVMLYFIFTTQALHRFRQNKDFIYNIEFKSPDKRTFIYSAYWDDRPNSFDNKKGNTPHIRLFGAAQRSKLPNLYCIFRTEYSWFSEKITYKHVLDHHGKEYFGYTMSCGIPNDVQYIEGFQIEISDSPNRMNNSISLEVKRVTLKKKNKVMFGICIPPLHGNVKPQDLIEFIELSQILGAEKMIFYTKHVNREIENILIYYGRKGVVDILKWNLPAILSELNTKIWYNGQDISVQDCLYRYMEDIKYISLNDIDEYIIPHKYLKWSTLIEAYDNGTNINGFRFSTAFFKFPKQNDNGNELRVKFYTTRTKQFIAERSKCIVKPEFVYDMGTHQIHRKTRSDTRTVWVKEEDAFLHHYRLCEELYNTKKCRTQVTDNYAAKFSHELSTRILNAQNILTQTRI